MTNEDAGELRAEVERLKRRLFETAGEAADLRAEVERRDWRREAAEAKVARVEALADVLSKMADTGKTHAGTTLGDSAHLLGALTKDICAALEGEA